MDKARDRPRAVSVESCSSKIFSYTEIRSEHEALLADRVTLARISRMFSVRRDFTLDAVVFVRAFEVDESSRGRDIETREAAYLATSGGAPNALRRAREIDILNATMTRRGAFVFDKAPATAGAFGS